MSVFDCANSILHCYESVLVFCVSHHRTQTQNNKGNRCFINEHMRKQISKHEISLQGLLFQELLSNECGRKSSCQEKCVTRESCLKFHSAHHVGEELSPSRPVRVPKNGCRERRVPKEVAGAKSAGGKVAGQKCLVFLETAISRNMASRFRRDRQISNCASCQRAGDEGYPTACQTSTQNKYWMSTCC